MKKETKDQKTIRALQEQRAALAKYIFSKSSFALDIVEGRLSEEIFNSWGMSIVKKRKYVYLVFIDTNTQILRIS